MAVTQNLTCAVVLLLALGCVNGQIKKSGNTVVSSVKCSASAEAESYSNAKDASVKAVATAIEKGCVGAPDVLLKDYEAVYEEDFAGVIAEAITAVDTSCDTQGNAFGCAAAQAYSEAYAEATAEAHSKAAAKALASCDCVADAKAIAFGKANTYLELVAQANSLVKAKSCAKNGRSASASVYQRCLGQALVKVFAKATADALIAGGCYSADAAADIESTTGADYLVLEGCDTEEESTPSGPDSKAATDAKGSGGVMMNDLSADFDSFFNDP